MKTDSLFLIKRPDKGLLAGLYGFPMVEGDLPSRMEALPLSSYRHVFSHLVWDVHPYLIKEKGLTKELGDGFFVPLKDIGVSYPLPTAFMKAFQSLVKALNSQEEK